MDDVSDVKLDLSALSQSGDTTWAAEASEWHAPINQSGITPLAFKVVILPDPVEEKTKGGIIVPVEKVTKDEFATTRGTIIAVSGSAFSHVTDEEWGADKPKPGDHVVFTRYAGFRCAGTDGKDYLIVKGDDVHAKL
jgi:co-chaperonin GroES (HSP10)